MYSVGTCVTCRLSQCLIRLGCLEHLHRQAVYIVTSTSRLLPISAGQPTSLHSSIALPLSSNHLAVASVCRQAMCVDGVSTTRCALEHQIDAAMEVIVTISR